MPEPRIAFDAFRVRGAAVIQPLSRADELSIKEVRMQGDLIREVVEHAKDLCRLLEESRRAAELGG